MSQFWCYRLGPVAERVLYLKQLEKTENFHEIRAKIHNYYEQFMKKGQYNGPSALLALGFFLSTFLFDWSAVLILLAGPARPLEY